MLDIVHDYSLTHLNTMALNCYAREVITLIDINELNYLPLRQDYFILSGGSNVLLPERLEATVLMPRFRGISVLAEDDNHVIVEVMAGENWHDFVTHCLKQGWYGLENLALIPGLVGAAPIQNIGAYGVSVSDRIVGVKLFRLETAKSYFVDKAHCRFSYRDSIFKQTKGLLITAVQFRLHKNERAVNIDYGDLADITKRICKGAPITAHHVMQAVIAIRQNKLPDPKVLANCGSFFQNPIITKTQFNALKQQFPNLPSYPVNDTHIKVPAGWLIDQAGLKGGGVAPILTHKNQALVLTNHARGLATQKHVKVSQDFITNMVKSVFDIDLLREPVWVNEDGSTISFSQS